MSYARTLQSLEQVLESFLQRAVVGKKQRVQVIDGINRLDAIIRAADSGTDVIDRMGDWFADHRQWLQRDGLPEKDMHRLSDLLNEIGDRLSGTGDNSPAFAKIRSELTRWQGKTVTTAPRLVLKRGPETAVTVKRRTPVTFDQLLSRLQRIYRDQAQTKRQLVDVLEALLTEAEHDRHGDALLLAGFILYYLKVNRHRIEPYVRRLKQAEAAAGQERGNA